MKSTATEIERRQVQLHIEAEADEFAAAQAAAVKHLSQHTTVPGFRKGKAPRHILEQHLGKEAIIDEAIEQLFSALYEQALDTHDIHPVANPQIKLEQREPPIFEVTVPLQAHVSLGDYKSVRVKHELADVTEEHVSEAIDRLRESQAVLTPVERPLAFGDFASIDVKATAADQPFLDHKQVTYEMVAESKMPLPGFAESIEGLSPGETKDFTLTVPEDFRITELAGKECACSVTVQQVQEKKLPELTDALAETFGFETLDALKERVGTDLESNAQSQARTALIHSALDAIEAQGEVDFAPYMEDREIAELIEGEARQYGYKTVEDYLRMSNRTIEDMMTAMRPAAHKRIVNGLILNEIAEQEGIETTDSDVDNRIEELLSQSKDKEKARAYLDTPQMRESLANRIRTNLTLDRLAAIVTADTETAAEPSTEDKGTPEEEENNG
ncbi:MAG: trigger factor [Dehalococcoidia bacterium]|nr:trigger factor [Dehalococcoidia bacterium]